MFSFNEKIMLQMFKQNILLKTPSQSTKLSCVKPGQYLDRRPLGNRILQAISGNLKYVSALKTEMQIILKYCCN